MKSSFFLVLLLAGGGAVAQCPDVSLTGTGNHCAGDTLTVHADGPLSQIVWYDGSTIVKTSDADVTVSSSTIVAGGNGVGQAGNQFYLPAQITFDAAGNLYVADDGNGRIQKFPPGSTSATYGVTVAKPTVSNSFNIGVCLDSKGDIFFADTGPGTISEWTPGATSPLQVGVVNEPGVITNNIGQLFIDAAGYIYVPENNRILKLNPATGVSVIVAGGSVAGYGPDQLSAPTGVWVDNTGNIYIADNGNHRIQKWAPGATAGITVAGGNGEGSKPNQLDHPENLCLDAAGNMYIADCFNSRIQEWKPGATEGITVAGDVNAGSGIDQLNYPSDVLIDSKGDLYISDNYNQRVVKWQLETTSSIDSTYITDAAGTYTAVISAGTCTLTTNPVIIQPNIHPGLSITATPDPVCANDSVLFTAVTGNTGLTPSYQWLVNGASTGGNGSVYTDRQPKNGDIITCKMSDEAVCALSTSNPDTITVNPLPEAGPGQEVSLPYGQSVVLSPALAGDVNDYTYSWSPAAGLSDTTIADPIADPGVTTQYTLQVTGPGGCTANTAITVKVFTQLRIPNAFTPNGDGTNDVFYVMGGPANSVIKNFAVFNRWGQRIFQVHGVAPGDPAYGWNGYYQGAPAPGGTYVYIVEMSSGNGPSQVFKGTVLLIR
jgi:gliding motility-associated-like protein